jgi:phosphotransferase system enzyme I (PtsI)
MAPAALGAVRAALRTNTLAECEAAAAAARAATSASDARDRALAALHGLAALGV